MSRAHRVLVVDDEPIVRLMYVDALAEAGHTVEVAANGEDALHRLRTGHAPCVVLSDVRMPRMDGWDLAREIRRDPTLASIPIVVLTGDRMLSFTSPTRDKPTSVAELDALVERSCRLHRERASGGAA